MSTLVRQNAVPATETTESTESTDATESTESTAASVLPETWADGAAMLCDILPLANKLDANGHTKQDRKLGCRRVVELASADKTNLAVVEVLGADAVKAYCAAKAPGSIDTYSKMACAFLKLVTHAQGKQDLPPAVCREIAALEGMAADCESNRRNTATTPPAYMRFAGPTLELFETFSNEHIEMNFAKLALGVWLIFTVLGVATRTRTMRTARWGINVMGLDKGDWRIKLGDEENPGTKHSFPLDIKLSELAGLSKAGLLYHDLAATALDWLYRRTDGDKHGRLVFSRNSKKNSQFGKDVFGKFMIEKLGAGMDCGSLRKRLEVNAANAAEKKYISPHDRSLVSCLLQHSGKTAGLDYSDGGHEAEECEHEPSTDGSIVDSDGETGGSIAAGDPETIESALKALEDKVTAGFNRNVGALTHLHKVTSLLRESHSLSISILNKTVNDLAEKVDGLSSSETSTASDSSDWLKGLAEEAEHLAYDNCRTEGDITRFQLALIKAARNKPAEVSANENAAYIKYNDLGEWLQKKTEPPPGDEIDSDSEYEQSDEQSEDEEETVRAAVGAILKAISKPRARNTQAQQSRAHKKSRYTQ